jgi:hypothetical protein
MREAHTREHCDALQGASATSLRHDTADTEISVHVSTTRVLQDPDVFSDITAEERTPEFPNEERSIVCGSNTAAESKLKSAATISLNRNRKCKLR